MNLHTDTTPLPLAITSLIRVMPHDFTGYQTHDYRYTNNAQYSLMFNPAKKLWAVWVTDPGELFEIEYSEHHRPGDAQARLARLYSQIERGLVH